MCKITFGQCVTEEKVGCKMVDHEIPKKRKSEKYLIKKPNKRERKKVHPQSDSQEARPSGYKRTNHDIRTNPTFKSTDTDAETDGGIKEEGKCCVCKKFTPDEVRNYVSFPLPNG